jgi:hypothetical protein
MARRSVSDRPRKNSKSIPREYHHIDKYLAASSELLRHERYIPPRHRRDPIPPLPSGRDPLLKKLELDAEKFPNSPELAMRVANYKASKLKLANLFPTQEATWKKIDEERRLETHWLNTALSCNSVHGARTFAARNYYNRSRRVKRVRMTEFYAGGELVHQLLKSPSAPIKTLTPGRALNQALGRFTRYSLSYSPTVRDDYAGEVQENDLHYDSLTQVEPSEPEKTKRRKRAYIPPREREMLSVVRLRNKVRPDGKPYTDKNIAQALQIPASRVKEHRLAAEELWAKYGEGNTRLGVTANRSRPLIPNKDQQDRVNLPANISIYRETSNSGKPDSGAVNRTLPPALPPPTHTAEPEPKVYLLAEWLLKRATRS